MLLEAKYTNVEEEHPVWDDNAVHDHSSLRLLVACVHYCLLEHNGLGDEMLSRLQLSSYEFILFLFLERKSVSSAFFGSAHVMCASLSGASCVIFHIFHQITQTDNHSVTAFRDNLTARNQINQTGFLIIIIHCFHSYNNNQIILMKVEFLDIQVSFKLLFKAGELYS